MEQHKAVQRKDGSIYCYCDVLPSETISVSVNHAKKSMMCSVCGGEVKEEVA